jgi:hypothetical protein
MKKCLALLGAALLGSVVILTSAMPASADGWRRGGRAHWRSSAYAFNDRITYNVITPYYYPYYGSHYSYVRPDPVPPADLRRLSRRRAGLLVWRPGLRPAPVGVLKAQSATLLGGRMVRLSRHPGKTAVVGQCGALLDSRMPFQRRSGATPLWSCFMP